MWKDWNASVQSGQFTSMSLLKGSIVEMSVSGMPGMSLTVKEVHVDGSSGSLLMAQELRSRSMSQRSG